MLRKLKDRVELKIIALSMIIGGVFDNSVAYASDVFDFLDDDSGNGAFSDITQTAKETGASFYQFLLVIGVIGLVLSVVALGISLSISKNAQKKQENKSHLPYIAGGAVLVFGATALLGIVKTVADGLNK